MKISAENDKFMSEDANRQYRIRRRSINSYFENSNDSACGEADFGFSPKFGQMLEQQQRREDFASYFFTHWLKLTTNIVS